MLTVVDIKKKDACRFIVTLNRDGKEMVYELRVHIPGLDNPDGIKAIYPPEEAYHDLVDYNLEVPPGKPCGAPYLAFTRRLYTIISQVNRGIPVELPEVLDER